MKSRITGFLSRPYRIYGLTDLSHQCVYCWKGPYSSVKRLGRLSGRAIDASIDAVHIAALRRLSIKLDLVTDSISVGPCFFCILHVHTHETRAWADFAARSSLRYGFCLCGVCPTRGRARRRPLTTRYPLRRALAPAGARSIRVAGARA